MGADRPRRILIVGINYAPEPTGIAPYTSGLAAGLARRGYAVTAVTGYPHYPWWKVAEGYPGRRMTEHIDGVRVQRRRHYVPQGNSLAKRALMELDFGLRAVFSSWRRPDVVVLVTPALISSRLAMLRARLLGVPVVTWVQDIYTLGLVETGGDARQARLVRAVERSLFQGSSRVVVIHDRFRKQLQGDLAVTSPVDVVRNWSHVEEPVPHDRDEVRTRRGWHQDDVVVLHAGNMGAKQGLENVVDAARLATDRGSRVRFVLMGSGNQRSELERRDPSSRLQFVDPLPDDEFGQTLAAADVLLVNERPGMTEMSVPSKLTTYYATGRPVLAGVSSQSTTATEIALSEAGQVVQPGRPDLLLEAAEELAADPASAASYGAAGREFRQRHLTESAAIDAFEATITTAAVRP